MGELRIETVDDLGTLAEEWRRRADVLSQGLPFRTWEWAAAWQTHFLERQWSLRDHAQTLAFRSRAGDLLAVAPLLLTHRPAAAPLLRVLDVHGTDPNVTELRGLACDPAWEAPVLRALVGHLGTRPGQWDWLHLRGLRVGGEGHRYVASLPGVVWERDTPAHLIALPATWEALKAGVSRNLKESLRHGHNSLARDGHRFTLEVARRPEEVAPALELFFELHRARAELAGTTRHPDVFVSAAARGFLRELCRTLQAQDAVRIFQLRIADEIVATRLAFALGDTLYLYYSGYQPAWGRYGVMTTTVAQAVRYAIASGFGQVHLSTGTDVSKTRWRPTQTDYHDAVIASPSRRGQVALAWTSAMRRRQERSPTLRLLRRLLGRQFGAG